MKSWLLADTFVRYSSQGYAIGSYTFSQWGLAGDVPMAADFDGDGKTDISVSAVDLGMVHPLFVARLQRPQLWPLSMGRVGRRIDQVAA